MVESPNTPEDKNTTGTADNTEEGVEGNGDLVSLMQVLDKLFSKKNLSSDLILRNIIRWRNDNLEVAITDLLNHPDICQLTSEDGETPTAEDILVAAEDSERVGISSSGREIYPLLRRRKRVFVADSSENRDEEEFRIQFLRPILADLNLDEANLVAGVSRKEHGWEIKCSCGSTAEHIELFESAVTGIVAATGGDPSGCGWGKNGSGSIGSGSAGTEIVGFGILPLPDMASLMVPGVLSVPLHNFLPVSGPGGFPGVPMVGGHPIPNAPPRVTAQMFGGKWIEFDLRKETTHPHHSAFELDDIPYRGAVPRLAYWGAAREIRRKNVRNRKQLLASEEAHLHPHPPTQRALELTPNTPSPTITPDKKIVQKKKKRRSRNAAQRAAADSAAKQHLCLK